MQVGADHKIQTNERQTAGSRRRTTGDRVFYDTTRRSKVKLIKKILLTTDFSKGAEIATRTALGLADKLGAEVIPIHVLPDSLAEGIDRDVLMKAVRARFRELTSELSSRGVVVKEPIVGSGTPFLEITEQADLIGADLIVLGGSVNAAHRGDRIGTTTSRVLRNAHKPVWVVPLDGEPIPKSILCAVDFSDGTNRVMRNATHLARALGAKLSFFTAVRPLSTMLSYLDFDVAGAPDDRALKAANDEMEKALQNQDLSGIDWSSQVVSGVPEDAIVEAVGAQSSDLLILGATGKSRARAFLLGSVAEKVTRRLPCSTLLISGEDVIKFCVDFETTDGERLYKHGVELLKRGFSEEAVAALDRCLVRNPYHVPAWESLAAAHERLGNKSRSKYAAGKAKDIYDSVWKQRVENEIRSRKRVD